MKIDEISCIVYCSILYKTFCAILVIILMIWINMDANIKLLIIHSKIDEYLYNNILFIIKYI
jgi:hypothetical protein